MSLSVELKKRGIRNVGLLAESEGVTTQTLRNWYKRQPELLQSAIERYLGRK